jgi:hypothetical protein
MRASFRKAADRLLKFEKILKALGVAVKPDSGFEQAALCLLSFAEYANGAKPWPPSDDTRADWAAAMALADLSSHAINVQRHPDFAGLLPHFALLNTAKQPAQNVRSVIDSDSDKLFELLAGLLALEVGTDVVLDDPNQSAGESGCTFHNKRRSLGRRLQGPKQ